MRILMAMLALIALVSSAAAQAPDGAEARLKQKNIELPAVGAPVANYVGAVRTGNLLFLSGAGPGRAWGGKGEEVDKDLTLEEANRAARSTGLNLLATARQALGSLDKVKRVVKVLGMVNSAPGFTDQPK